MQSRIRDALLENGLGWQLAHMRQPVVRPRSCVIVLVCLRAEVLGRL